MRLGDLLVGSMFILGEITDHVIDETVHKVTGVTDSGMIVCESVQLLDDTLIRSPMEPFTMLPDTNVIRLRQGEH